MRLVRLTLRAMSYAMLIPIVIVVTMGGNPLVIVAVCTLYGSLFVVLLKLSIE